MATIREAKDEARYVLARAMGLLDDAEEVLVERCDEGKACVVICSRDGAVTTIAISATTVHRVRASSESPGFARTRAKHLRRVK